MGEPPCAHPGRGHHRPLLSPIQTAPRPGVLQARALPHDTLPPDRRKAPPMPGERGACQQRAVLKPSVALVANTGAVAAADRECCFGIGTSIRGLASRRAAGSTWPDAVAVRKQCRACRRRSRCFGRKDDDLFDRCWPLPYVGTGGIGLRELSADQRRRIALVDIGSRAVATGSWGPGAWLVWGCVCG